MEAKTSIAAKFLDLSPLNLYGYTVVVAGGLLLLGTTPLVFSESSRQYVLPIVLPFAVVLVFSYVLRFYCARNITSVRQKLIHAPTTEKAFHIICGGYIWGIGSFFVAAIVFAICMYLFVL